jgi:glutathione peroxidase
MKKSIYSIPISTLSGDSDLLSKMDGNVCLIVNVASECGLTKQYSKLEDLHRKYSPKGFSVIGVPCNQFNNQEPGTPDEISNFCSKTYGVTFPLAEKIDVNGFSQHELYLHLNIIEDSLGHRGEVRWNFEKFLISRDGVVISRFSPQTEPDDPQIINAIESALM